MNEYFRRAEHIDREVFNLQRYALETVINLIEKLSMGSDGQMDPAILIKNKKRFASEYFEIWRSKVREDFGFELTQNAFPVYAGYTVSQLEEMASRAQVYFVGADGVQMAYELYLEMRS